MTIVLLGGTGVKTGLPGSQFTSLFDRSLNVLHRIELRAGMKMAVGSLFSHSGGGMAHFIVDNKPYECMAGKNWTCG